MVTTSLRRLDLDEIVDGQKAGGMSLLLGLVAALVLVSDGFDLAAMGLIAPALIREWQLGPTQLVPAFTAGILGMMVGGPLLGMLGDRFGRRRLLQWGLLLVAAATLLTVRVATPAQLTVLRFLTGIGLGGLVPNVVALVAELTPRRFRGRMVVVVTTGMVLGMSLSGLAMAALGPRFGWRAILVVGGAIPLAVALLGGLLPESIKFLAARGDRAAQARQVAMRLRPDLAIGDDTVVVAPARDAGTRAPVSALFRGGFLAVTPLLWLVLATAQLASFFAVTWLPTLLQATGVSPAAAGVEAALFSAGGLGGSLILILVVDRYGALALAVLLALAVPLFAAMAFPGLPVALHRLVIVGAGFCTLGAQQAIVALIGLVYPTPLRSSGSGIAQSVGRLGSIAAPALGGALFAAKVSAPYLPAAPAAALLLGAAAATALTVICRRAFGGFQPGELALEEAGAAPGR